MDGQASSSHNQICPWGVSLFVKSGVKWHLSTNRETVTLSSHGFKSRALSCNTDDDERRGRIIFQMRALTPELIFGANWSKSFV